uniref:Transcriptional regulator n=1 Tax=Steinernema glaseri TaxID=37863 RepID=A0A1I8A331_9BILA
MQNYANVSQQLKEALKSRSSEIEGLQRKLEMLKERMGNITLDVD